MTDSARPRVSRAPRVGGEGDVEVFVADEQSEVPLDTARWARLAREVLEDPLCTMEQLWLGASAAGLLGRARDPEFMALIDGQMDRLGADAETRAWIAETRGGPVSPFRSKYGSP